MKTITIKDVSDCEHVFSNEHYVILSGKNPWIFSNSGMFIAKLKKIYNVHELVFLSDDTVLMSSSVSRSYFFVSLVSGEILWEISHKGRHSVSPNRFAVLPDKRSAYYIYRIKQLLYVDQINPHEHTRFTYSLPSCRGAVTDCHCDRNGNLLILHTWLARSEAANSMHEWYRTVCISRWSPGDCMPRIIHKHDHATDSGFYPQAFGNTYILYDNLKAVSLQNGEIVNLLQSTPTKIKNKFRVMAFDSVRKLLTIRFTGSWSTVIVDCIAHKIVAHYVPLSSALCGGCLINDTFWVGTHHGVVQRPFPHEDDYPEAL